MALNYVVEKDFGDNSHPFTPLALNKTFLDVNGYDNESGVDGKILEEVEYPVTSGNKPFSWVPLTETTSVNDLSAALANRYPVTVRVKFHSTDTVYGHTVLVTDQEVATGGMPRFKIHDPGLRTNLYLDTAYQNNFIIKGYVKSESQNLSGLQRSATVNSDELAFLSVSSGESIQLMVIDPLGRRTGFDPSTQQRVNEIPNSSYNDELNINPFTLDPLDSAPLVRTVSVYDPLPGTYQIVSFGVTTGAFKLDFKIISRTGQLRRSLIAGSIQAGATVNSSFDYVDDPSPTPTPTPTPTGTPTPTPTPTPTTGTYANASIALSGSTTVTHDGPVTNASYATATTTANFKGRLEVDPTTGTVRVTNAHPAGDYLVTVTVYYSLGAMATKTFTLTVTTPVACNTFGPTAFAATTNSGVGSGVYSVVVGDFNGDGKQDLVTANQEGNSVSVLLRNAANTGFDPKADFPVGGGPDAVAVGDLNGDGRQDIVAANTGGNNVSVLLRNAANTGFDAQVTFLVGNSPLSVAVGELNGDRKQDIVTANANGNSVSVLQRNAANTGFDPKLDFAVGGYPDSVAVGDFNGDGKQDIVTANGTANSVSVLLRNTANTGFDAQAQFAVGTDPTSVAVGDFNGDGKQDIVAANVNSSSVSVLQRNSANTSFDPKVDFAVGNLAQSVAVGDFNGDGKQDIVAGNFGPNIVSVLLRNAANTSFDPTVNFAIDAFGILFSVAVGDFNGDHRQDVVAAINGANIVSVLQGNCNAAPTPTPTPTPTPNPTPIPTPTATPLQLLLDQSGPASDQVAALDSILFLRDPFPVVNGANLLNLGVDRNTKISVLVMNLQLTQGESSSSVLVNLIDSNNQSYDVAAEDVRLVPTFNFTQVIFRLPNNLPAGTCTIKIKAHGQISNAGTIRIRI
jgi:hypothetical protein